MDEVSNQMSSLKAMVDIQTITRSNAPIFSIITLGSKELPYFISAKAFGDLSITNDGGNIEVPGLIFSLTSLKYEAFNSYFIDQSYIFEAGGIIVTQPDGTSVMRVEPSINAYGDPQVNLFFNITTFVGKEGKNSTNGYGKCLIRTSWSTTEPLFTGSASYIKINTRYPHAWNESLHNNIGDMVEIELDPSDSPSYVRIIPLPGKSIYLYLNKISIEAQIGPGWVI